MVPETAKNFVHRGRSKCNEGLQMKVFFLNFTQSIYNLNIPTSDSFLVTKTKSPDLINSSMFRISTVILGSSLMTRLPSAISVLPVLLDIGEYGSIRWT